MRVAVIDHSDIVRLRLVTFLNEAGVNVVTDTGSFARIAGLLAAHDLDAIVADVEFPGYHPVEIVVALRAGARAARLVIVTNVTHHRKLCLARGADVVLDKSTELDSILAQLSGPAIELT